MTYSLDLYFVKSDKKFPGPPRANVCIKTYSRDESGPELITPNCITLGEFEYEINRLHKELDDILKKARKKFSEAK
jgi:hypothetical protein